MDSLRVFFFCLSLAFCSFAAVLSGFSFSFNVYALPLKSAFNFTQTEVEVVASMDTLGIALIFLETFTSRALGNTATAWIYTLTPALFSLLFALAILYRAVLGYHLILISVIELALSTSNNMTFMAISKKYIDLFPESLSGTAISLVLALSCFGKIFFGLLVDNFFFLNVPGLFFTLSTLTLLTYGCSFLCLHLFATKKSLSENTTIGTDTNDVLKPLVVKQDVPSKDVLLSPFFHGVFWTTVLFYSCGYTCLNNVTVIAESVGVKDPVYSVYVFSVVTVILRPTCGVLFDKFNSESLAFAILQINFACFMSSMLIGIYALETSTMFLSTILSGIGFSSTLTIGMSIFVSRFGRSCYSMVLALSFLVASLCQVILQISFGYFYDIKGEEQGLIRICFGRECFFWSFLIMLLISTLASSIQLMTFMISYIQKRKNEQSTTITWADRARTLCYSTSCGQS